MRQLLALSMILKVNGDCKCCNLLWHYCWHYFGKSPHNSLRTLKRGNPGIARGMGWNKGIRETPGSLLYRNDIGALAQKCWISFVPLMSTPVFFISLSRI